MLLLLLFVVVGVAVTYSGRYSTMCRAFSLRCLFCLSLLSLLPHFSPSASSASDPVSVASLFGPLSWLFARLCAFLWHCACRIRRQSRSTMLFSTTSCFCSTHLCLHTFDCCFPLSLPINAFLLPSSSLFFLALLLRLSLSLLPFSRLFPTPSFPLFTLF